MAIITLSGDMRNFTLVRKIPAGPVLLSTRGPDIRHMNGG